MKKISINKAKQIVRQKAKKEFPEISKDCWYFNITEWEDGDFSLEYIHNFGYENKINSNPETRGRISILFLQATKE